MEGADAGDKAQEIGIDSIVPEQVGIIDLKRKYRSHDSQYDQQDIGG